MQSFHETLIQAASRLTDKDTGRPATLLFYMPFGMVSGRPASASDEETALTSLFSHALATHRELQQAGGEPSTTPTGTVLLSDAVVYAGGSIKQVGSFVLTLSQVCGVIVGRINPETKKAGEADKPAP